MGRFLSAVRLAIPAPSDWATLYYIHTAVTRCTHSFNASNALVLPVDPRSHAVQLYASQRAAGSEQRATHRGWPKR